MSDGTKYLPFLSGEYSTAPGIKLSAREKSERDRLVFQIDENYAEYIKNKEQCRSENIRKYHLTAHLKDETIAVANKFISKQLALEHPNHFTLDGDVLTNNLKKETLRIAHEPTGHTNYLSLFDALCCQVQEDLAVFQLTDESEYLAAIHLCSPNHWSPADKIGQPFDAIHKPVAGMEKTLERYRAMLQSIVKQGGPFVRFAWGIGTDNRLNHHPVAPDGIPQKEWDGRSGTNNSFFLRVERQNLVGFPEVNAFLFTIRTYFYPVDELESFEKAQLWKAINGMTEASREYKGIKELLPELNRRLKHN
ncbi:MAG: DUF3445 domain-containing protein [Cyclobacteriaceae bacterium]